MTTYQILGELSALYELMIECDENGELIHSEADLEDFVKEIKLKKEDKLDRLQDLKIFLKKDIEAYDEKIAKLNARKKALENDIERAKNLQLVLLDGEKCKTSEFNFYFMNTESVDIDTNIDINEFNPNYVRVKKEFDKTSIKKALKDGEFFDGVSLVKNTSLVVR